MDISIIEFGIFGFLAYSSILMLIISTIKDVPDSKPHSIVRAAYMIPGIFGAILLAGSGVDIQMETETIDSTIFTYNETNDLIFTENQTSTNTNVFTLQNPIWIPLHYLLAAILIVYFIQQILILLTKV